jgi:hypothetical protein
MSDLQFQDISTVASPAQLRPPTIASAATIAPQTFLSLISGTVAVATITPPVSGAHLLCLIFTTTTPTAFTTTGNILAVATPTTNLPVFLVFDPGQNKYVAGVTKAS